MLHRHVLPGMPWYEILPLIIGGRQGLEFLAEQAARVGQRAPEELGMLPWPAAAAAGQEVGRRD
jgi:hypothetical protein